MIQVFKPRMHNEEILKELSTILSSGWIGLGPRTKQFEEQISKFLNCRNFVATNSCTSSLHLAIRCLNLPDKSKILTSPITFVSTNEAILYEGHIPVFYDIEFDTGCVSIESLQRLLKQHHDVKAIMVVHFAGYPCDMDKINQLALEYGIDVIEDCAHAFGSEYKGKKIGDTDNLCVWSFQAVKNLPIGDGGGISTKDDKLASRLRRLIWLGIDKSTVERSSLDSSRQSYNWDYDVTELGYKYHMNDIAATIGLVQLKHLESDNKRRLEIATRYKNEIAINCIKPNYDTDRMSSYHFYPILFSNRNEIYKKLTLVDIYPGMHYKRNDKYSIFMNYDKDDLVNADKFESQELTLPLHLHLTDIDVQKIIDTVNG
jgi:perosamine synthetase